MRSLLVTALSVLALSTVARAQEVAGEAEAEPDGLGEAVDPPAPEDETSREPAEPDEPQTPPEDREVLVPDPDGSDELPPLSMRSEVHEDDEGSRWYDVVLRVQGRKAILVGIGYELGLESDDRIGHLHLQAGWGWTVMGRWISSQSRDRMDRLYGSALYFQLVGQLGIPLESDASRTQGIFAARAQQIFAFGRNAISILASGGMRWDIPHDIGAQVGFGLGWVLILPPGAVPINVEVVRQYRGVFEDKEWGLRVWLSAPLGL